jgi:hypothetical protein
MASKLTGVGDGLPQQSAAASSATTGSYSQSGQQIGVSIPEEQVITPRHAADNPGDGAFSSPTLSRQTTQIVDSTDDEDDTDVFSDPESDGKQEEKEETTSTGLGMSLPGGGSPTSQASPRQRRPTTARRKNNQRRPSWSRAQRSALQQTAWVPEVSQAEIRQMNAEEEERRTVTPDQIIRRWLGRDASIRQSPAVSGRPAPTRQRIEGRREIKKLKARGGPEFKSVVLGAAVGLVVGGIAAAVTVATAGIGPAVIGAIVGGATLAGGIGGGVVPYFGAGHRPQKSHLVDALNTLGRAGETFTHAQADRLAAVTDAQWRRLLDVSELADEAAQKELRAALVWSVAHYGHDAASTAKTVVLQDVPEDRVPDPAQRQNLQRALIHMIGKHDPDGKDALEHDDLDQIISQRDELPRDLSGPGRAHIIGPSKDELKHAIEKQVKELAASSVESGMSKTALQDVNRSLKFTLFRQGSRTEVSRTGTPRTNARTFHESMSAFAGDDKQVKEAMSHYTDQSIPNILAGAIEGQMRLGKHGVMLGRTDNRRLVPEHREYGPDDYVFEYKLDVGIDRLEEVNPDDPTKSRGVSLDPAQARLRARMKIRVNRNDLIWHTGKLTFVEGPHYDVTWPERTKKE